jgi:hypothetical protein
VRVVLYSKEGRCQQNSQISRGHDFVEITHEGGKCNHRRTWRESRSRTG